MSFQLFRATTQMPKTDGGQAVVALEIVHEAASGEIRFQLKTDGKATQDIAFAATSAWQSSNGGSVSDLEQGAHEITLTLADDAPNIFQGAGLLGAAFGAQAELTKVRFVIRAKGQGGDWTPESPAFELHLCWNLDGALAAGSEVNQKGTIVSTTVEAGISIQGCIGLSMIRPDGVGLGNFQVRVDASSFGLSTGWLPLALMVALPPLRLDPLVGWFAKLMNFKLDDWGLNVPGLPDWSLDMPVDLDLPLGVGVQETRLRLWKPQGATGLALEAVAKGFVLTWDGQTLLGPFGEVSLTLENNLYVVRATLGECEWPKDGQAEGTFGFSLPFDVIGLSARAWYLSIGLYFDGKLEAGSRPRACFEALLEIGGLQVDSRFAGQEGLYRTDLRLLMRDLSVMSNSLTLGQAPLFFARAKGAAFIPWKKIPIPALSFARDLLAPPSTDPANDYGVTFLDGAMRRGERAALLWRMNGAQLIKALAHDLFGSDAAGMAAASDTTVYALEWLSKPDGGCQLRLDWRGGLATREWGGAKALTTVNAQDECIVFDGQTGQDIAISLPVAANPKVSLDGRFDRALTLNLPLVRLDLARPQDQALILTTDGGSDWSLSHLLIYPAAPEVQPAGLMLAPLAVARIGFSVSGDGKKDGYETDDQDGTFLTLGLGPQDPAQPVAFRTFGWRKDRAPRFLQTASGSRAAIRSLIPVDLPSEAIGDPGCPGPALPMREPGLVDFDSFDTPDLGDWSVSIRLAAQNAVLRMFKSLADTGQNVSFKITRLCQNIDDSRVLEIHTDLTVKLGGSTEIDGEATLLFDLSDLSIRLDDTARLSLKLKRVNTPAWAQNLKLAGKAGDYFYSKDLSLAGLTLTAIMLKPPEPEQTAILPEPETSATEMIEALVLDLRDGQFILRLAEDADLVLRLPFSVSGEAKDFLAFKVDSFAFGPGGLDVDASLLSDSVRLPGLDGAFSLTAASLRMVGGRLDLLEIKGAGVLPAILDSAPVTVSLVLGQKEGDDSIKLLRLTAELGDRGKPIFSRGTRFKFEIEELDLFYDETEGAWFELTGTATFTDHDGAFSGGLIGALKSVTISFTRMRLSDNFIDGISIVVELNKPIEVELFDVFKMEIRSIGLHPNFTEFDEPAAAVIIGGQVMLAESGDVVQAEIDFHQLYIGMPRAGSALPQVHCKGLRVVISSSEGFKIGGRVDSYESDLRDGFAGEGVVQVPGLPELAAAFAFVRVRKSVGAPWYRAWFVAIEASKISYQVGGALPIFLRQIGLGFGYRYTLPLITEFSKPGTPSEVIGRMLAALDQHQTLARIDSWLIPEDPEPRDWSIALEGVLSLGTTQPTPFDYDAKSEKRMRTIFAQLLAAYRSDFTLVAATKIWFPVSVDDFFEDRGGMRARPLAKGFIAYSAPQNRLLAHARKSPDPYLGDKDDAPFPYVLKAALDAVEYEVTLLGSNAGRGRIVS